MMGIRKDTSAGKIRSELVEHEPQLSLGQLAKQIENDIKKRNETSSGFKPASQLMKETAGESAKKKETNSLSSRRGFSFKRSPNHQTPLTNYFSPSASTSSKDSGNSKKHVHNISESESDGEGERDRRSTENEDNNRHDEPKQEEKREENKSDCESEYDPEENQEFDQEEVSFSDLNSDSEDECRKKMNSRLSDTVNDEEDISMEQSESKDFDKDVNRDSDVDSERISNSSNNNEKNRSIPESDTGSDNHQSSYVDDKSKLCHKETGQSHKFRSDSDVDNKYVKTEMNGNESVPKFSSEYRSGTDMDKFSVPANNIASVVKIEDEYSRNTSSTYKEDIANHSSVRVKTEDKHSRNISSVYKEELTNYSSVKKNGFRNLSKDLENTERKYDVKIDPLLNKMSRPEKSSKENVVSRSFSCDSERVTKGLHGVKCKENTEKTCAKNSDRKTKKSRPVSELKQINLFDELECEMNELKPESKRKRIKEEDSEDGLQSDLHFKTSSPTSDSSWKSENGNILANKKEQIPPGRNVSKSTPTVGGSEKDSATEISWDKDMNDSRGTEAKDKKFKQNVKYQKSKVNYLFGDLEDDIEKKTTPAKQNQELKAIDLFDEAYYDYDDDMEPQRKRVRPAECDHDKNSTRPQKKETEIVHKKEFKAINMFDEAYSDDDGDMEPQRKRKRPSESDREKTTVKPEKTDSDHENKIKDVKDWKSNYSLHHKQIPNKREDGKTKDRHLEIKSEDRCKAIVHKKFKSSPNDRDIDRRTQRERHHTTENKEEKMEIGSSDKNSHNTKHKHNQIREDVKYKEKHKSWVEGSVRKKNDIQVKLESPETSQKDSDTRLRELERSMRDLEKSLRKKEKMLMDSQSSRKDSEVSQRDLDSTLQYDLKILEKDLEIPQWDAAPAERDKEVSRVGKSEKSPEKSSKSPEKSSKSICASEKTKRASEESVRGFDKHTAVSDRHRKDSEKCTRESGNSKLTLEQPKRSSEKSVRESVKSRRDAKSHATDSENVAPDSRKFRTDSDKHRKDSDNFRRDSEHHTRDSERKKRDSEQHTVDADKPQRDAQKLDSRKYRIDSDKPRKGSDQPTRDVERISRDSDKLRRDWEKPRTHSSKTSRESEKYHGGSQACLTDSSSVSKDSGRLEKHPEKNVQRTRNRDDKKSDKVNDSKDVVERLAPSRTENEVNDHIDEDRGMGVDKKGEARFKKPKDDSKPDSALTPSKSKKHSTNALKPSPVKPSNSSSHVTPGPSKTCSTSPPVPDANETATHANKKQVADWVVKYLMPHYKNNDISGKDLFKSLARQLSHVMIEKGLGQGKTVTRL